jgi:hypothetical protein
MPATTSKRNAASVNEIEFPRVSNAGVVHAKNSSSRPVMGPVIALRIVTARTL